MKTKKTPKSSVVLKPGDKVYVTNNCPWGMVPMKVTNVSPFGVTCKNSEFSCEGLFNISALEKFTKVRERAIKKFKNLQKQQSSMKESLFGYC